ncbi:MAG TPA: YbhB/YbcL family Raf kinase inhibitor-like protein [Solirubrobacteraceae bacterium]
MRPLAVAAVVGLAVLALLCLAGCGGGEKLAAPPPAAPRQLTVTSPDFGANGSIPQRFTCDGDDARPALRFAGVPDGAAELALLVVDPDAGGFVHWTAFGLSPSTRALAQSGLPAGAREGENSDGGRGWTSPCPPSGTHRYEFRLYWLKRASGLQAGAKPEAVAAAVRERAGGSGVLVGRYQRR